MTKMEWSLEPPSITTTSTGNTLSENGFSAWPEISAHVSDWGRYGNEAASHTEDPAFHMLSRTWPDHYTTAPPRALVSTGGNDGRGLSRCIS